MSRRILVRALLVAAVATLAILPARALAAQPLIFHFNDSGTVENVDLCGINVDVAFRVALTDKLFLDQEGNIVSFQETGSTSATFTAENGKSVVLQTGGQVRDAEPVIDEAANTITFRTTFLGLPEKIQAGHGPVLLRDAGFIEFVTTFDLTTFDLVSSDVIIKGPHPEAESDFTLFCQVITDELTDP
jgi:hypothetical protein